MIKKRKYQLPPSFEKALDQKKYERWLSRKAATHVKRDRKRGNKSALIEAYKLAIHKAVRTCGGIDAYTGEKLRWDLLSTYNNDHAKQGRRTYKAKFALLPTVDHVGDGLSPANFKICSWRTNDAKGDLTRRRFISLCERAVEHCLGSKQ